MCGADRSPVAPQLLAGLQDRRLDLLVGGAQDLPPQQRTLRKAIGYSYNLLDDGERTLFRSLGIFVGGCGLGQLEAVSAWGQNMPESASASTLHALISKSLVYVETTLGGQEFQTSGVRQGCPGPKPPG